MQNADITYVHIIRTFILHYEAHFFIIFILKIDTKNINYLFNQY